MDIEVWLCVAALFAGFVDSVAGGGGLIQLPFLMIFRPDLAPSVWLGTNKFSSVFGTSAALLKYSTQLKLPWANLWPSAVAAFLASFLGAVMASHLPRDIVKPLIIGLLVGIFFYTLLRPDWGRVEKAKHRHSRYFIFCWAAAIGFYDGFFGPGTGGFLIFLFISVLGMNFLKASASAKIINWATNIAALIYFGSTGSIAMDIGIPMAACNLVGGAIGARVALKKGVEFVRILFYIAVVGALTKLLMEYWI